MTVSVGELNNRLEIFAERISELEDMYEEFLRYGPVWQGMETMRRKLNVEVGIEYIKLACQKERECFRKWWLRSFENCQKIKKRLESTKTLKQNK